MTFLTTRSLHQRPEQLRIRRILLQRLQQMLHRLHRWHVYQVSTDVAHGGEGVFIAQLFFLARAGLGDVQRREDALVGKVAVERQFHVAGTFELFEDHLIHAAAGVDEAGGENGE